jgi:hypothetical protein
MSKSEDQQLNRRDFLRGGAILFGGVAAGILPKIAEAQVARPTKPVSGVNVAARLMFWNGTAFVPASELPAGDASLSAIALRLRANSNDGGLKGLDVVFSSATKEPFLAWTSPSRGGTTSGAFTAPVSNGTLSVVAITTGTTDSDLQVGNFVLDERGRSDENIHSLARNEPGVRGNEKTLFAQSKFTANRPMSR